MSFGQEFKLPSPKKIWTVVAAMSYTGATSVDKTRVRIDELMAIDRDDVLKQAEKFVLAELRKSFPHLDRIEITEVCDVIEGQTVVATRVTRQTSGEREIKFSDGT